MEKMKEKLSRCTKKEKKDIFKEPKKISKNNIKEVTYGKVFQLSNLMIYGSSRHHRTETLSTASVLLFWKEICCQGAMPTTTGVRKEKSFRESLVRNQVVVPSFQKQQNRYGHSSRTNSTCSESSNCKKKVFIFFCCFCFGRKKYLQRSLGVEVRPFPLFQITNTNLLFFQTGNKTQWNQSQPTTQSWGIHQKRGKHFSQPWGTVDFWTWKQ